MEIRRVPDAELVHNLRSGVDLNASIKTIYRDHFDSLSWFVVNNSGSRQDAEDVFQEVVLNFIELVQKDKFRGESTVKTFLFSLNKHIWLNELKRKGRAEARELKYERGREEKEADVSDAIVDRESKQKVMEVVEQLGDTCKKILILFYYENRSMKEILDTLEYENEQVVRNKKYKCLKQLEKMLNENPALKETLKSFLHG
jgi:RNA polymerase sigma factor (sigma-70 family)